jgi:hypothetical protein
MNRAESFDNSKLTNSENAAQNMMKKRRDPKSMSIEELEDYINKNKSKLRNMDDGNNLTTNNKSLNSSFQSQKNTNLSFNINNLMENKFGIMKKISDNINPSSCKENNLNQMPLSFSPKNDNKNLFSVNNFLQKQDHNNQINNINPFLKSTNEDDMSKYKIPQINLPLQSHLNPNINQSSNNNILSLMQNQIQNSSNHTNTNNNNTNSAAASNYLKTLQEKIKSLSLENEELKTSFVQINEILEKERKEFTEKIQNENDKFLELEQSLRNQLQEYENENKLLGNELDEMKIKISFLNTNMNLLENEKERHLDQNALDKESFQERINNLFNDVENRKLDLVGLQKENLMLKEKCNQMKEMNLKMEKEREDLLSVHKYKIFINLLRI